MATAICLQCGAKKRKPYAECARCGYQPHDDKSLIRSVYLSIHRYEDPQEQDRYADELDVIAERLATSQGYDFDEGDLRRLREQWQEMAAVTNSMLISALARCFLPGVLLVGGLLLLVLLLRNR